MEPGGSLPHLQQPATYPYAESGDSLLKYIIEANITHQQPQLLPFTVVKVRSCTDGLYFILLCIFFTNIEISILVFRCEDSYLTLLILYNVFNCIK